MGVRGYLYVVALAALSSPPLSGCGEGSRGIAVLNPPAPDKMVFSKAGSETPFLRAKGEGPLARTSFSGTVAGYAIDVRDFLIGPAMKEVGIDVTGAALLEVREGEGTVTVDGKLSNVSAGTIFSVSDGVNVRVQAHRGPLVIRAHMFKVKQ